MASCSGTGALGRRRTIDGAIAAGFRAPNAARPLSCSKSSHSLHTRPRSALCTGAGTKPQQREVRRPYSAQTTSLRPRVPSSQSMSNLRSSLPQRRAVPVRASAGPQRLSAVRRPERLGADPSSGMSEAKLEVYSDLWDAIIVQDEAYGKLLTKVKRAYDSYIHKLRAQKGLPVGMSKAARQAYDGLERGNSGVLQQRECIEEVSLDDSQAVQRHAVEPSLVSTPPLFPDRVRLSADIKRPDCVPRLNLNPRRATVESTNVVASVTCSTGSTIMEPAAVVRL
ncbi:hypothetical protein FOZ63_027619 [Perkinsus olseni]|uniref:Translin-associated factor X-interacting protein 1 N-terminal domain-containing protein n=1 Tax=Perkinsus olseni TaxID=32597 RepID=A0A7J6RJT3_PEROL|nr:hypothetical protein FOZ63_027619 [Perkinsus olseni]